MEKMDSKLKEKFDKLGDKLRTKVFIKLKHALEHIDSELGSIKQYMPVMMEFRVGRTQVDVWELAFAETLPKDVGMTIALGISSKAIGPLVQDPGSFTSILDSFHTNLHRSKLDCP